MTLRPPPPPSLGSGRLTKEQLLQKIEAVDRDIAATESQIAALLKRQAELEGNTLSTPSASTPSPLHPAPLPPAEEGVEEEGVSLPSEGHPWSGPRKSLLDSVYSENKVSRLANTCWYVGWGSRLISRHSQMKARSAQAMLRHLSPLPLSSLTVSSLLPLPFTQCDLSLVYSLSTASHGRPPAITTLWPGMMDSTLYILYSCTVPVDTASSELS